jgi:MOSC domain-containing protein YiiM
MLVWQHHISHTCTERFYTMRTRGTVRGIAVREASRAPMKEQQQVEVTLTHGIVQDYRGVGLRQVTFLDVGQWQEVLAELGVELPWYTRRANVLIEGLDLPATMGRRLQIGACRFAIGGETTPCERMDELQPGLRRVLIPSLRGGVWGKVLQGGPLHVGDEVQVL